MERDYHSTSCKVQFTGKLVNGKIKANKIRSSLPISDFSILILFPPSLNVHYLYAERDHRDCVGTRAELTQWSHQDPVKNHQGCFYHSNHWFNVTEVKGPNVKGEDVTTPPRWGTGPPLEGLRPATELRTRNPRTVGRSRLWSDSRLLGQRGIHLSTETATRKDTEHVRVLLSSLPRVQLPHNFSEGTELWVLLHQKHLAKVQERLRSLGSVY